MMSVLSESRKFNKSLVHASTEVLIGTVASVIHKAGHFKGSLRFKFFSTAVLVGADWLALPGDFVPPREKNEWDLRQLVGGGWGWWRLGMMGSWGDRMVVTA